MNDITIWVHDGHNIPIGAEQKPLVCRILNKLVDDVGGQRRGYPLSSVNP